MLGMKKEKVPFGMRKSKGTFGKKPSNGTFGKKPSKPLKSSGFKKTNTILKKRSKTNIISAEEREFMKWLHSEANYDRYPCFVCGKIKHDDKIEWHHVKEYSSDKKNHKRLIPLCGVEHHRLGQELSPHGTPKKWRETYSMQEQMDFAERVWNDFQEYKSNIT